MDIDSLYLILAERGHALLDAAAERPWSSALIATAIALLGATLLLRAGRKRPAKHATDPDERARIDAFLAVRRIALVGASRDPQHFSRMMMRELVEHGIDVVPVHPAGGEIEGRRALPSVGDIAPPVEAALVMTPPSASAAVVEACAAAGVKHVWLHRGAGTGAVSEEAVAIARARGLSLVAGRCPLMFLGDPPAAIHRLHGAVLKLERRYPRSKTTSSRLAESTPWSAVFALTRRRRLAGPRRRVGSALGSRRRQPPRAHAPEPVALLHAHAARLEEPSRMRVVGGEELLERRAEGEQPSRSRLTYCAMSMTERMSWLITMEVIP